MSIAQPEFTTHYLSMGNMAEGHLTVTNKILPDPYNVQPQFYYTIWSQGNGDSNKISKNLMKRQYRLHCL